MPKLPSFPFYPGDWLRNSVAGCSLEAQGLWLRMMIVMHDADVYGELSIDGLPMSDEFIAKKCGVSVRLYRKYLQELVDHKVINFREISTEKLEENSKKTSRKLEENLKKNRVIYSGRMVRDEHKRQKNAERQRDWYNNHKNEPNAVPNEKPNTPSSFSSSSSSSLNPLRDLTEAEPEAVKTKTEKSPIRPKKIEDEIKTWLDAIAKIVGAKDGKDIADYRRWRETVEQCVRAERLMPEFLAVVRSEFKRTKDTPQFFTPASVLKAYQAKQANGTGNGSKPDWQIAIENCKRCDPSGTIFVGDKAELCNHK